MKYHNYLGYMKFRSLSLMPIKKILLNSFLTNFKIINNIVINNFIKKADKFLDQDRIENALNVCKDAWLIKIHKADNNTLLGGLNPSTEDGLRYRIGVCNFLLGNYYGNDEYLLESINFLQHHSFVHISYPLVILRTTNLISEGFCNLATMFNIL